MKRIQTLQRKQLSYQTILEQEKTGWNCYVKDFVKDIVDDSRGNVTNSVYCIDNNNGIEEDYRFETTES